MKYMKMFTLTILMVVMVGCSSLQEQGPMTEDFHYRQMENLQGNDVLELGLFSIFGGQDQVQAAVDSSGRAVYQGDMVLAGTAGLESQGAIVTTRKWLNNTVPYTINASTQTRRQIQAAVRFFNERTHARWVPRTNQSDYVEFINSDGCWSYVGRIGGKQQVGLGGSSGCGVPATLHEMGHAVGFHHEQSRRDRNQNVRLNCNIVDCQDINWAIQREAKNFGKYDYYSIMHYGAFWGNQQVIFPLQAGIDPNKIGASSRLTAIDIAAVNFLYP
jgi:Astacin (Peptidase family M12A)